MLLYKLSESYQNFDEIFDIRDRIKQTNINLLKNKLSMTLYKRYRLL